MNIYIESRVKEIFKNETKIDYPGNIDISDKPIKDLGVDSFKYITLILAIEKEFSIEFDDEFHDNHSSLTIKSLVNIIEKYVNK
jgi:acyl carrier protein